MKQGLLNRGVRCESGFEAGTILKQESWFHRHGRKHCIMPTAINYRANIHALKQEGCTHVVVTTACGSLKEEYQPGDIVFPDQFIDRTTKRVSTFYDGCEGSPVGICHIPMHEPYCPDTRKVRSGSSIAIVMYPTWEVSCHWKIFVVNLLKILHDYPHYSSWEVHFLVEPFPQCTRYIYICWYISRAQNFSKPAT